MKNNTGTQILLGIIALSLSVLAFRNLDIIGSANAVVSPYAAPLSDNGAMMGEIRLFAGDFAPKGWVFCEGQTLEIEEHTALFTVIGNTYGGDGEVDFQLPDLRGRTPVGVGLAGRGYKEVEQGRKGDFLFQPVPKYGGNPMAKKGKAEQKSPRSLSLKETTANKPVVETIRRGQLGMRYIICMEGFVPSKD